uniref:Uncharacterized protein n=1 Tax=Anguilla anguilla TaxID=7936 RepID=A0A0E9PZR4_ANGAN
MDYLKVSWQYLKSGGISLNFQANKGNIYSPCG